MSARAEELKENHSAVLNEIQGLNSNTRLVAVSKFKPASDIEILYGECGQVHFGENYVQELVSKASELPKEIQWHFIGTLQSNKCKDVAGIENLYCVETIDSVKKAVKLDAARGKTGFAPIGVAVQVNTSGEENKSGCSVSEVLEIVRTVKNCEHLVFRGLMTIGSFAESSSAGTNKEFDVLVGCRDELVNVEGMQRDDIGLSMGMSADYAQAIAQGSTSVRVGSAIFGSRS